MDLSSAGYPESSVKRSERKRRREISSKEAVPVAAENVPPPILPTLFATPFVGQERGVAWDQVGVGARVFWVGIGTVAKKRGVGSSRTWDVSRGNKEDVVSVGASLAPDEHTCESFLSRRRAPGPV